MKRLIASLLLLGLVPLSACARNEPLLGVGVQDLDAGSFLDVLPYAGRDYIEGQPGHRFAITLHNNTGERVLAVVSVDGVNAISGQTASTSQAGYVLEPWQQVDVRGWRKSFSDVAEFYFTDLPDSYAARTGRPQNVGVIGVATFRERHAEPLASQSPPPMIGEAMEKSAAADSAATGMARRESSAPSSVAQQIGTGHGERRYDPVGQTQFQRASSRPDQRVLLYYDSREALVARGVIDERPTPRERGAPDAFPIGFAADPPQ